MDRFALHHVRETQMAQLATGVGALRKLLTAYHSSCRYLLKPWLCAVFGRMTYWRSPFVSLRKNSSRSSSVELPSHSPRVIRTGASTLAGSTSGRFTAISRGLAEHVNLGAAGFALDHIERRGQVLDPA